MTTFAIKSIDANGVAIFQNGTGNADPLNVWLERAGVLVAGSWGECDANAQGWTYVGAEAGDVPFAQRLNATSPVKGPPVPAPPPPPPPSPPPPTGVQVSTTPSLPASVLSALGPLKIALLEGFAPPSLGGVALGTKGAMFGPNRDPRTNPRPGFNGPASKIGGEQQVFGNAQNTILPAGGLLQTCTYTPGIGKVLYSGTLANTTNPDANYLSACICSAPANQPGGAPGWPGIQGFGWWPQAGVNWVFEFDITVPPLSPGFDLGLWSAGPSPEIDFPEMADNATEGTNWWNIINHATGAQSPNEYTEFGDPVQKTGGRIKYTTAILGVTSMAAYKTVWTGGAWGTPVLLGTENFPSGTFPTGTSQQQALIVSYAYRQWAAGVLPTWQGSETVTINSIGGWTTNLANMTGGGIAPGTLAA